MTTAEAIAQIREAAESLAVNREHSAVLTALDFLEAEIERLTKALEMVTRGTAMAGIPDPEDAP